MPEGMRRGTVGEYGWVRKEKKEKKKKMKRKKNTLGNALIEQGF